MRLEIPVVLIVSFILPVAEAHSRLVPFRIPAVAIILKE